MIYLSISHWGLFRIALMDAMPFLKNGNLIFDVNETKETEGDYAEI